MSSNIFLEDIYPKQLLHAVTIRSPVAKGQIKLIHYPKLPENYTIITARNIPGKNKLDDTDIPILADRQLSYIGEPVALLLGPDKTQLEELSVQCVVIADEEIPVFSPKFPNVLFSRELQTGNTDDAFEKGEGHIVTGSYATGIQDHWYAEPAGAITWIIESKEKNLKKKKNCAPHRCSQIIIKTATQWSYQVKRSVAQTLGVDPNTITVEPTKLSLHMDGKLWLPSLIACHAALGTYITKKPVRLIFSRDEDFYFSPKRCGTNIDIATTVNKNGTITSAKMNVAVNLGAFGVNQQEILDQICLAMIGIYKIDNFQLSAKAYSSNLPPQGPFSGFGLSQGFFAIERHVSLIADMYKLDPAVWRLEKGEKKKEKKAKVKDNIAGKKKAKAQDKDLNNYSDLHSNLDISNLLNRTIKMSDYNRKWASYELLRRTPKDENPRGIGIAFGFQGNGLLYSDEEGVYTIEATLTKDKTLEIKTNMTSSEDYEKIWEKIAVQTISVEPDKVIIKTMDAPDCGPSCASRNISVLTKLVEKCCLAIRKQRSHSPLPITVRRSTKPQFGNLFYGLEKREKSVFSNNDVLQQEMLSDNDPGLQSDHDISSQYQEQKSSAILPVPSSFKNHKPHDINSFTKPGQACAVVEVSIDLVECMPKIRGVWIGVDGGKIISKNRARRSLIRGAVQALGWAFTENIEYIEGKLPKYQYENFSIPSPVEIPPIHIEFLENDLNNGGQTDPKGIGELPFTCIPAAFLQAVSQAMDHAFKSIPLKRKDIWEMAHYKISHVLKTTAGNR